jgi:hypothetical protein
MNPKKSFDMYHILLEPHHILNAKSIRNIGSVLKRVGGC